MNDSLHAPGSVADVGSSGTVPDDTHRAPRKDMTLNTRRLVQLSVLGGLVLAAALVWWLHPDGNYKDIIAANGRIEATDVYVSAKAGGRVTEILVREGTFVKAGQPLARMQTDTLEAQLNEALANQRQVVTSVATSKAQLEMRKSDFAAAEASIVRAQSDVTASERRLTRSETLSKEGASSIQELDDDRARVLSAHASLDVSKAQAVAAQSAVEAARAQVVGAEATVAAASATVARIQADIRDNTLVAPRDGRVQYRVAEPGEVIAPGGPVLNLVDLGDVYITFFLPETLAGRIALGSEVRIVLDAAPTYVIPATVSFVASVAQFTPKTVETASERQKLMFRVKAQIDRDLLQKHLAQVKTGVPGVAWVKLSPQAAWPQNLALRVPGSSEQTQAP